MTRCGSRPVLGRLDLLYGGPAGECREVAITSAIENERFGVLWPMAGIYFVELRPRTKILPGDPLYVPGPDRPHPCLYAKLTARFPTGAWIVADLPAARAVWRALYVPLHTAPPAPSSGRLVRPGAIIVAKWGGLCAICRKPYQAGESISYDGRASHPACATAPKAAATPTSENDPAKNYL